MPFRKTAKKNWVVCRGWEKVKSNAAGLYRGWLLSVRLRSGLLLVAAGIFDVLDF
jgi:hypothetical protein